MAFIWAIQRARAHSEEESCRDYDQSSLLQRQRQQTSAWNLNKRSKKSWEIVDQLISEMSFDEKADIVKGTAYSVNEWNPPPGYFVGNTGAVTRLGIPSLNLQDNGQGYRTTDERIIGKVTAYPSTLAVAATWDEELGYTWGEALGKEFFAKGGNVLLGPGLNVHRVPRNGRNVEYLSGESSYLGEQLVKGYIKGVHSQNVLTVMKHFIGNSQETWRSFVDSKISRRALWEVYYPPFQGALDAGCLSTMCAYNLVNGIHACANEEIMNKDLKGSMGYEGFIMSDWWALHSFSALQGLDQEMPGNPIEGSPMNQVYFTNESLLTLPDGFLDGMLKRILLPVVKYGLIDHPVCNPVDGGCDHEIYEVDMRSSEHQALARRMVAESVILLKNEDDTLPLGANVKTIAVVGSACEPTNNVSAMLDQWDMGNYYTVGGSGRVIPKDPVSILQGIQGACEEANCTVIFDLSDDAQAAEALVETKAVDVLIICGATTSAEGRDRPNLMIDQQSFVVELAEKMHSKIPTVVVTLIPGSIVMPWNDHVDAAVAVFLAGEATGLGIADVLFGKVNPGAKSPVTFPLSESDTIPPCEAPEGMNLTEPTDSYPCNYTEGILAGFPFYEEIEVQYPFGHGLSYSTFGYELLSSTQSCNASVCITVRVTNSGAVAGSEVIQFYLVFPPGLGEPKEGVLRGFKKVFLQPDESKEVSLELREKDVSIYDETEEKWKVPSGIFRLKIGSSSRDIRVQSDIQMPER